LVLFRSIFFKEVWKFYLAKVLFVLSNLTSKRRKYFIRCGKGGSVLRMNKILA
uniref:Glycosyltransferase family 2 protein n=1 Tax=Brugia timori TaxID=42155 RepID=A0A0R3QT46_9BILA